MHSGVNDLVARLRPKVVAELAELRRTSQALAEEREPVQLDQQSVGRLSRMDAMQVQAMALAAENRRQARIASLEAALLRMDRGVYGECLQCDDSIDERRLAFDPAITRCISCARRHPG